ncbi:MAG TPA: M1 family aminopeptidase [Phycisphaerae bacterium]|nr:M1 family aminopeptidase [Phycisphaerae bacterium]
MLGTGLKLTVILAVVCLATGPTLAGGSPGDLISPPPDQPHGVALLEQPPAEVRDASGDTRGPGDPQPETPWTDVLHTKIDIGFNLGTQTLSGLVTITALSQISGLNQFVVYLDKNGGLMSLNTVGGSVAGPTSFTHVGDKVTVTLNTTYNVGQQFTVTFNYGGKPRGGGPCWGSHGSPSVPIMATNSEPFYARYWWVGKDVLDDKCTFDIWVTVPNTHVVAANGILRGTDQIPGSKLRYRWEETYPMIPYLASLAIADYQVYSTTYTHLGHTMPMSFYLLPEHNTAYYRGYCDTYVTMTQVFADLFGEYPFITEKGGMAETPTMPWYMEHQTLPSMPTIDTDWINSHELAHQWWGDTVTCQTWGDTWLNEGFASFCEAIWEEYKPGGSMSAYHSWMNSRLPYSTDAQLYVTDVNDDSVIFAELVYDKGAWVVHMLRHLLGDPTFFQALANYRASFEGSSATTTEFINSVSATAGYNLTFFTNQWVMNPGSPDYNYGWRSIQAGGRNYVLLRVSQTQTTRGYPNMTMPVDIRVTTGSGQTTYVVWCANGTETFAIPVSGVPSQVALDPDDWILTHSVSQSAPGTFTSYCQGDMNQDGHVDGRDIQQFVDALVDSSGWPLAWRRADMNFDGRCDAADVPLFVQTLLTGCPLP